jgi:hypothetical protein
MKALSRFAMAVALSALPSFLAPATATAQTPPASPAPSASPRQTVITEEYDGKTHTTLSPYIWLPTINGTFQYMVPHAGRIATLTTKVAPNSYLSHVNFAAMGDFEIRKGDVAAFADYIDLNVSNAASYVTSVAIPSGVRVPVDLGSNTRVHSSIWETAASLTLAHSDTASIEAFSGWRQAALNGTLNWNINLGKGGAISRSGSVGSRDIVGNLIFGLRGKLALGDGKWYVPYYIDYGTGATAQSWQAYTGIGRATRGGSFLLAFRELNYDFPAATSFVQKIRLGGPLVGYSFKL